MVFFSSLLFFSSSFFFLSQTSWCMGPVSEGKPRENPRTSVGNTGHPSQSDQPVVGNAKLNVFSAITQPSFNNADQFRGVDQSTQFIKFWDNAACIKVKQRQIGRLRVAALELVAQEEFGLTDVVIATVELSPVLHGISC